MTQIGNSLIYKKKSKFLFNMKTFDQNFYDSDLF